MFRFLRHLLPLKAGLGLSLIATLASAATDLVKNGLLTEGQDDKPGHWRSEGYSPGASAFTWVKDADGMGALHVASTQPNDARWVQDVPVSPNSWHRISGWIRAENVGAAVLGAHLSVLGTFFNSRDLRGSTDWQPVVMWVKTGKETSLQVACRLGGYSAMNTGVARCTGISVVPVVTPRTGDPFVFGSNPDAQPINLVITSVAILVVISLLILAWRALAPSLARTPGDRASASAPTADA